MFQKVDSILLYNKKGNMYARLQLVALRGWSQAGLAAASTPSDMSSGLHCFLGHGGCKWVINLIESVMGGFCKRWCDFRRGFKFEVWKTKDTFLKPEGSPIRQLNLPLTTTYLSIFCGACSKGHRGKRWIPVKFWKLQSRSLCELSCQWFTFLSLCLVPFSLREMKTLQGNRALATY